MKVLIVYDSRSGNTEKMAQVVAEGVKKEGVEVEVKRSTRPLWTNSLGSTA